MNAIEAGTILPAQDTQSFEAEYQQASRAAFLLARQLGCSTEEALDAVQDAAERAWRYRASCRGPFRPWFLGIVYRTATKPRFRWLPLPSSWRSGTVDLPLGLDPDLLVALRKLPSRQRAALWLRYGEDLTSADVARVIQASEAATRQLLSRARTTLRKELEHGQ